jgi:predicted PurR-regulated permease PerM
VSTSYVAAITSFVSLLIGLFTIVGFIAKAQEKFSFLYNRLDLLSQKVESLKETEDLRFNGIKERLEHLSSRLGNQVTNLESDVEEVQNFLTKTTEFQIRRR